MNMGITDILKKLVLEQSRYEVLVDKWATGKKKASGKKVKPKIELDILQDLMQADPTTKGEFEGDRDTREITKVGAYTQWLIKQWMSLQQKADAEFAYGSPDWGIALERHQKLFMEDLYKVTEDLMKFDYLKKTGRYKGEKDINRIPSVEALYDQVKDYKISKEELTTTKAERVRDDAEVVYEDSNWLILVPKTKEASCHYGGGQSRWCTASKSSNYYDHYAKQGPLYMILHKEDMDKSPQESRSHQFHFESNSFMNAEDRSIELGSFFQQYPELKPFFKDKFAKFLTDKFENTVEISQGQGAIQRYIQIYGFEDLLDRLPPTLERLDMDGGRNSSTANPLSPKILNFKKLKVLHVENSLSELPDNLGTLTNLEFLSVPNNPSLKSIPLSILNVPNLEVINIRGNKQLEVPQEITDWGEQEGHFLIQ
tara:strand:+ start:1970 stop:3250 length:1281 start_codon:yes stop_codon:yes gene_type:complete